MIKKLTERIFYMPHSEETDRPSLGLICGNKYSLIIDSGNSPKHAKQFLTEINSMDIPPVKYLVITHWHWDHIFGMREMDFVTIGHKNTKVKLEEMKGLKWDDASLEKYLKDGTFTEFTINCIKEEISKQERDDLIIDDLDIIFSDNIQIDLGGITCIVKEIGGDHTDDSSVIYIPEEKVLFLGDCVYGSRYYGEYGYTMEKLLPMLENIRKYESTYYIVSHEDIWDKKQADEFRNQLRLAGEIVGEDTSTEESAKRFSDTYDRQPTEDEAFLINCFANVNKAKKRQL